MKITFLSQKQLATVILFVLSGLIELFLMKVTPSGLDTLVFLISAIVLFYISVEVSQNYTKDPIILDFRSEIKKEEEEKNRARNLIEGLRNNLLMQIAQNQISVEKAENIYFNVKKFEEDTNPLLLEEKKALQWKEELHQSLKIGKEYEGA